jgi:hypothetical protein
VNQRRLIEQLDEPDEGIEQNGVEYLERDGPMSAVPPR